MADKHFDVIVIGGGPGGYVGAIRAAQLGFKTAIVERAKLGGVCLNWGCIPSKALLSNAELMEKLAEREFWGLSIKGEIAFDWDKVIGRSRDVAGKLNKGVEFLMKKNKIEHFVAHAKITSGRKGGQPCKIEIYDCKVEEERTDSPATPASKPRETITADHVIIATGSIARDLPFAKFDHDRIWGAREAMFNKEMPKKLVVVGAGAIGMEFGYFYHSYGTKVTIVEMQDRIVPVEDEDVSRAIEKIYKKKGFDLRTSHVTTGVEKTKNGVKATIAPLKDGKPDESKKETIEADRVLLAIGVKGRYDGLFDTSLGLKTERDHVSTDYKPGVTTSEPIDYKTNIDGIYAIGDVIGPPWLAHVAGEEAILCVERIAWRKDPKKHHEPIPLDYSVIPGCTYCQPQIGSVGFTEQALKAKGMKKGTDYEVGTFPFTALGKAIAAHHTDGFTKIIRGLPRGEILGAHILGDQATELIAEMSLARRLEATSEEIICTVHAHPTMHESVREAALASEGRVINA
ncbi:MAG: dihydrolipoyl dehydrogenase [Phycisphaerales bacterium]|jgi:dihydrolipoamide dehydrogenase|nr:dihydrolipoyl dehydrogenase [Phycisphaerales bacterium]